MAFGDITKLTDSEKGKDCLTYGEVNDLIPPVNSSDVLDDLFATFGTHPDARGVRISRSTMKRYPVGTPMNFKSGASGRFFAPGQGWYPSATRRNSSPLLETEPRRELKATRTELGDNGTGRTEVGIGIGAPQLVRGSVGVRADCIRDVLHIIDDVLLEVGMVEDVEGLGSESKLASLAEMKFAGNA